MSLLAIFLSLVLLMVGAYRGLSVLLLAPALAALAVGLSGELPLLASYTQIFMMSLGNFTVSYFPIFLLGSLFGKLMEDSGFARSVAQGLLKVLGPTQSLAAIVLSCGLLTYGGVSAFVVVFTVYPLAASLFWQSGTPKRLIPGCIALGALTFSMTALPGTAQIHNIIPMSYFGTTAFAAPVLGLVAGLLMLGLGMSWLTYRLRAARANDEGYGYPQDSLDQREAYAPSLLALFPILVVIATNFFAARFWLPHWETSYLAEPLFGSTNSAKLQGTWAMILGLLAGLVVLAASMLMRGQRKKIAPALNAGAMGALLPTFNTASEVGYGATIAALTGFALIRDQIFSVAPGNPLVAEMISVNVLSGITGSASGGLSIALGALGKQFLELGLASGISPETLHRVASLSSGGLDTLPHNGAVITLLTVCGLSHRDSYKDICVVSLIVPVLVTVSCVSLGLLFGLFTVAS